ncbi:ThiF family adenylyltransferase [Leptolyngbya sp. PCC 6406]|uniref:ThiF family adenylyltransferase n=1 Tax=Leptolyngbya sp. PCC 6406 TaxID=1173264 RepID=UPI0002AC1E16|nr:ThiF family adenylyltransferase [Leptolyngbya sp. PCC 6406]
MSLALNLDILNARPVVLPPAPQVELWLIGCGGTGSFLVQLLCRVVLMLQEQGRGAKLVLVDPDGVEAKNITRQCFCGAEVGSNKAHTLARRYGAALGLPITAIAEPFSPRMPDCGRQCLTVLCGCVDNAEARRSILAALDLGNSRRDLPMTWWIDGGNSEHHGQVLAGNCTSLDLQDYGLDAESCLYLPAPNVQAPELLVPRPEERLASAPLSCAELAMANAQSLMVNPQVATVMGRFVLDLLTGHLERFATTFDQRTGTMASQYSSPQGIRAMVQRHARGTS